MTTQFHYSIKYVLDKSHFSETFDQTAVNHHKFRYNKPIFLSVFGASLLFLIESSAYLGWFIIALGILEALSIRFEKPWWLARQMISKAANSELTLTIDDEGISSESFYVKSHILWSDISKIQATDLGWLLYHAGGKTYVSNRCLSTEAIAFIGLKA